MIAPLLVVMAIAPWLAFSGRSKPTCPNEPITLDRLHAVIAAAAPPAGQAVLPDGVRTATTAEITALRDVMAAFVACSDAGEPLRVLGLYTDRYVGELYYRQGHVTAEQYAELSRAEPATAEKRTRLLAVTDVEGLADGRVSGQVVIRYAVIPTPKRFLVTIAPVDGGWRIDDVLGELTFALP